MAALKSTRIVYVAPAPGGSGVGDYAVDFASALVPHVGDLVQVQVAESHNATLRAVAREARRIRRLVDGYRRDGPTIVHFEQSGASLVPFWAAMMAPEIPVTATIHDPPQPVWWPFASRTVLRSRWLHHGLHYPLRPLSTVLQRRMADGRVLMTLTSVGAEETERRLRGTSVVTSRHFIPARPTLPPLTDRPLAVGLFGYLYKAKGFDGLARLRATLDDDVDIVVAGRGTEALPTVPGVRVLGEVNGTDEDDFFARIRCLLVPYAKNTLYGPVYAASGTVSRAFAYGTPCICSPEGALSEVAAEGGAVAVEGGVEALARRAGDIVRNSHDLNTLAEQIDVLKIDRSVTNCAVPLLNAWAPIALELT